MLHVTLCHVSMNSRQLLANDPSENAKPVNTAYFFPTRQQIKHLPPVIPEFAAKLSIETCVIRHDRARPEQPKRTLAVR